MTPPAVPQDVLDAIPRNVLDAIDKYADAYYRAGADPTVAERNKEFAAYAALLRAIEAAIAAEGEK